MFPEPPDQDESSTQAEAPQSSAGGAYVGRLGILLMSAYLMFLGACLLYSLVALWPVSVTVAITSVAPSEGQTAGGRSVTISGTGFSEGVQVFFDNTPSTEVTRISETKIQATAPPHKDEGLVSVQVSNPSGQKSSLTNAFKFSNATATTGTTKEGTTGTPVETGGCPKASIFPLFEWACPLRDNIRLLLIVIIVGALGGLIHVMRSFYWYVGNRDLRRSWLLMYILLPFVGAGLALLFYLIIRGGFAPQSVPTQSSIDSYAALAALVGMFSQQALAKLKQIAESVFTTADKGKDQATSAALQLKALNPASGPAAGLTPLTLTGTNFSGRLGVTFGGTPGTSVKLLSDTQLQVVTPAHAAGVVDVEVSNNAGQRSSLPRAFTYIEQPLNPATPAPNR